MTDTRSSVEHMPSGAWEFDENVAACFDDMLQRSIPGYETMRHTTTQLAARFVRPDSTVLDLGCSRGWMIDQLSRDSAFGAAKFVGLDESEAMVREATAVLEPLIGARRVEVRHCDLRDGLPLFRNVSVSLCVLTLQFIPVEYRTELLRQVWDSTLPGGAILLVEKVLAHDGRLHRHYVDLYHRWKEMMGYSSESVATKAKSLEGVMVPLPAETNAQLLRDAGFRSVETYWRWLNFAGWIGVRP